MAPSAPLHYSLALLARVVGNPALANSLGSISDPLAINLPPLGGYGPNGGGRAIDLPTLELMAALYFEAELERAAVIPVAEILADSRVELQVTDAAAAQLLESFSTSMRGAWYRRELREQLFARTFGLGGAATLDGGMAINRDFEGQFARMCQAFARAQQDLRWGPMTAASVVQLEMAIAALLDSLARRRLGNTLAAARTIQEQLSAAISLLNHAGIKTLFMAHSLWDLIRVILGPDTPDLARIVARAQSGLRLLEWLAANLSHLGGTALGQLLNGATEPFLHSATWLEATGVPATSSAPAVGPSSRPHPVGGPAGAYGDDRSTGGGWSPSQSPGPWS